MNRDSAGDGLGVVRELDVSCRPMDLPSLLLLSLRLSERWKSGASIRCRVSRVESLLYIAMRETSASRYLPDIEFVLGARGPVPVPLASAIKDLIDAGLLTRIDPRLPDKTGQPSARRSPGALFDHVLALTPAGEVTADGLRQCWPSQTEEIERLEGRFAQHGHVELDEYIYMKYIRPIEELDDDLG